MVSISGAVQVKAILIQKCQNYILHGSFNALWYVRNNDIHEGLAIPIVAEEIKRVAQKHEASIEV